MKKLSASIVLYKTPQSQIETVLKSIFDSACIDELFIIDNSPSDKWRILQEQYKSQKTKIRYIHNQNLGYGNGHNIALQEAVESGMEYHLVLNPDIYFEKHVLSALINFMDQNPDASYVLPKVIYPNGELQYLCRFLPKPFDLILRRFLPSSKLAGKRDDYYCLKFFSYDKIINPPCLSGCFMFLRLSYLKKYNIFFDDRFFMYFEDYDLIRRLHRVSKTLYYPDVQIVHDHAKESYKNKKMFMAHIKSAFRYFNKYGWFFDKERRAMNKAILKEIKENKTSLKFNGGGYKCRVKSKKVFISPYYFVEDAA